MENKICKECNETKPISDYYYRKENKRYRLICKKCWYIKVTKWRKENPNLVEHYYKRYNHSDKNKKNQIRYYENNHEYKLWLSSKQRSGKLKLPFNLEVSDIVIPETCPVLKIPIQYNIGCVADNSVSLDRIVPQLGYVKGNIQILSHKANAMKYKATPEELLLFADWVYKTYK